jgi:hypothetical protein
MIWRDGKALAQQVINGRPQSDSVNDLLSFICDDTRSEQIREVQKHRVITVGYLNTEITTIHVPYISVFK